MTGGTKAVPNHMLGMAKSPLQEADSSTDASDKGASVECPACDRDDFEDKRSMGIHRAAAHGRPEIECDNCGAVFETKWSKVGEKRYCSLNCEQEHNSEDHVCEWCGNTYTTKKSRSDITRFCSKECKQKNHSVESRDRVTVTCESCGKEYDVKKHREDTTKYCSRECPGRTVDLSCEYCGEEYTVSKSYSERGSRFCSYACKHKWQSEYNVGENNPTFKGGHDRYYGSNWRKMRQKARERDGYQCQACGLDESDSRWELSVHHIRPLRDFDTPEEANTLDNLVSLCRSCHGKWEGIPVKPKVIRSVN